MRHRHHAQKVKGPAQQEGAGGVGGAAWEYGHKALSLGILYYANRALANACAAASIKFPSPLIGGPSRQHPQCTIIPCRRRLSTIAPVCRPASFCWCA